MDSTATGAARGIDLSDLLAFWATLSWWTVRISFILGLCCLLPGLSWILYDFVLWSFRSFKSAIFHGTPTPPIPGTPLTPGTPSEGKRDGRMVGRGEGLNDGVSVGGDGYAKDGIRRRGFAGENGNGDAAMVTGRN